MGNGFAGRGYDIKNLPLARGGQNLQSMTDSWGFLTALRFGTELEKEALCHIDIVCSNFIFLCRSKSQRTEENGFWGNYTFTKVDLANCLLQRSILVACVMVCARVRWLLEQPGSSCLRNIEMLNFIPAPYPAPHSIAPIRKTIHGFMGPYGARTRKPTYWIGDTWFMDDMKVPMVASHYQPTDLVVHRADGRVDGVPSKVKATEAYPQDRRLFGFACGMVSYKTRIATPIPSYPITSLSYHILPHPTYHTPILSHPITSHLSHPIFHILSHSR